MSMGAWGGRGGGFSGDYQDMAMQAYGKPFDVGIKFKMKGTCQVCSYHVYVLVLDKEDFVAKYYHLTDDENEVCTECWMKAKMHDPDKDKFTMKLVDGEQAWGIKQES
jgi:hypothetical protein